MIKEQEPDIQSKMKDYMEQREPVIVTKPSKPNKVEILKDLNRKVEKMGGLGCAHLGSPDWEKKKAQRNKMNDFGRACRLVNERNSTYASQVKQMMNTSTLH